MEDIEEDNLGESEESFEDHEGLDDIPEDTDGVDEELDNEIDDTEEIPEDTDASEIADQEEFFDGDIQEDVTGVEDADENVDVEDSDAAEHPQDVADTETADETSDVEDIGTAEQSEDMTDTEAADETSDVEDAETTEQPEDMTDTEAMDETSDIEDASKAEQPKDMTDTETADGTSDVEDTDTSEQQEGVSSAEIADETSDVEDTNTAEQPQDVGDNEATDETSDVEEDNTSEQQEDVADTDLTDENADTPNSERSNLETYDYEIDPETQDSINPETSGEYVSAENPYRDRWEEFAEEFSDGDDKSGDWDSLKDVPFAGDEHAEAGESSDAAPIAESPETPEINSISDYMNAHNYGPDDFVTYSQDPQWRQLMRQEYPDYELPELSQESANAQLSQYMNDHNYGVDDYAEYSQDPVWRELHSAAFPDDELPPLIDANEQPSDSIEYTDMVNTLEHSNVEYRPIELHDGERTEDEIVEHLSGGDLTEGSCSSLALAYAGNKGGYDVLDFRDGESRSFFSSRDSIQKVANLSGVKSTTLSGTNDIDCANQLLESMTPGKEYYLATGQHASIVRNTGAGMEYLELQHPTRSGWHKLDNSTLMNRFGCRDSHSCEFTNYLMDVDSLSQSKEFLNILGYINTADSDQRKGGMGNVR